MPEALNTLVYTGVDAQRVMTSVNAALGHLADQGILVLEVVYRLGGSHPVSYLGYIIYEPFTNWQAPEKLRPLRGAT